MTTEDLLLDRWRSLPLDKQHQVLDFVEFLQHHKAPKRPRRSLRGVCAELKTDVTEAEIAEARREMWATFPRENL